MHATPKSAPPGRMAWLLRSSQKSESIEGLAELHFIVFCQMVTGSSGGAVQQEHGRPGVFTWARHRASQPEPFSLELVETEKWAWPLPIIGCQKLLLVSLGWFVRCTGRSSGCGEFSGLSRLRRVVSHLTSWVLRCLMMAKGRAPATVRRPDFQPNKLRQAGCWAAAEFFSPWGCSSCSSTPGPRE